MKTGKLLYITDGVYIKYRGITTIPLNIIPSILYAITSNDKYYSAISFFKLPTDRLYLESEFEVITDD